MCNFWHSVQYMDLHNRDKNKGKYQSFVKFTKKKNNDGFLGFTLHKKVL